MLFFQIPFLTVINIWIRKLSSTLLNISKAYLLTNQPFVMASLHLSELLACLAFSIFYLLSIVFVLIFLYVSGSLISFLLFYLHESLLSSHRPPVVGTIFHLNINFNTLFDYFIKLAGKHRTFRFVKFYRSDIYTTDPANIEYFLKDNFSNYTKSFNYTIMNDLFGDGIFTVDGEKWKHQRKLASYEFSTYVLRKFSTAIFRQKSAKLANKFTEIARTAVAIDLQELLMKFTMDSLCEVGFGVDLDTLAGKNDFGATFLRAFDESNYIVFQRYFDIMWKVKRQFNIGLEAKLKRNMKMIDEFVFQLIQCKREQMECNAKDKSKEDILSRFILASQEDAMMNDQYLRDIILSFLIAGKDTTANTLSWFFFMMCKNPLIEKKIVTEIKVITEFEGDGSIDEFVCRLTEEALDRMQYLHAALTETLRLFPVVPLNGKSAKADDELPDGFTVKKGDGFTCPAYAMGRMTYLWGQDAEEFLPERWIQNGAFRTVSPFKFVSFNAGPRICLGKDFAYRQMKIVVATLLFFFKFKLKNPSMIARYKTMFTLHIDNGLPVIPVPRFFKE